ncbi:UDP-N-acetylmuramate dehydrogenase [Modicisalibacter xianhensis]|uniref:UDP-N-acetylenolpyruvoylglucosamine reductase n=1 Tax=Modicisalibacter xianhensis TaxID=442341 RepID=A0A4R8FUE1_9GAMM|nr:UDP-N-acetylmuramate dehydrogenase [Halomonas xianhensis]TDX30354.1 UDP-N-acetylmuramate dehydrogenase [Halomonas xianhensis]
MMRRDVDLQRANTLGLPCRAEHFLASDDLAEIRAALRQAKDHDWSLTVLGGGSNLVLYPQLPGLVLQPTFSDFRLEEVGGGEVLAHVGAGRDWPSLVVALAECGLWGTENLALIPGHAGAAPIQNIGAYGVELADVLEEVHLLDREGQERQLHRDECAFGYRDSIFKHELKNRVVITRLVLRLSRHATPRLDYGDLASRVASVSPRALDVVDAVSAIRREKLPDPRHVGNAGSFFKNPVVAADKAQQLLERYPQMPHFPLAEGGVKLAAGWLIDQCGLKGVRDGHVGVHDRQALVLVHHGGGSAEELLALAAHVSASVQERFGVALEREPRLMGKPTT